MRKKHHKGYGLLSYAVRSLCSFLRMGGRVVGGEWHSAVKECWTGFQQRGPQTHGQWLTGREVPQLLEVCAVIAQGPAEQCRSSAVSTMSQSAGKARCGQVWGPHMQGLGGRNSSGKDFQMAASFCPFRKGVGWRKKVGESIFFKEHSLHDY